MGTTMKTDTYLFESIFFEETVFDVSAFIFKSPEFPTTVETILRISSGKAQFRIELNQQNAHALIVLLNHHIEHIETLEGALQGLELVGSAPYV